MAEANLELHPEDGEREEQRLKYLDFVHTAAVHAVIGFSKIYDFAKDKSGPLRSSVETVEGTVKTVVRPVCDKFHDVPTEVLMFVDRKIDVSVAELDRRVPNTLKQVSTQAISAAQKSPEVARAMAEEVRKSGIVDKATGLAKSVYTKCEPTAKGLYSKYEPKAEECAACAWRKMNQLPLFPQVAQVVLPTARYCTEKYNDAVLLTVEKGYRVSPYLPLVPTEKISRVFSNGGPESEPLVSNADLAVH